ncbi:MAG: hypothetical protein Q7R79_05185 [bacterium]|nr:hypothetical protein [bacterium]
MAFHEFYGTMFAPAPRHTVGTDQVKKWREAFNATVISWSPYLDLKPSGGGTSNNGAWLTIEDALVAHDHAHGDLRGAVSALVDLERVTGDPQNLVVITMVDETLGPRTSSDASVQDQVRSAMITRVEVAHIGVRSTNDGLPLSRRVDHPWPDPDMLGLWGKLLPETQEAIQELISGEEPAK